MGNMTADPELKTTPSGVSVVSFSIAVGRRLSKEQSQDPNAVKADFINIVAWRNTAEFVARNFSKGNGIAVVGQIQVRSYKAQDGSKRYVKTMRLLPANRQISLRLILLRFVKTMICRFKGIGT